MNEQKILWQDCVEVDETHVACFAKVQCGGSLFWRARIMSGDNYFSSDFTDNWRRPEDFMEHILRNHMNE